MKIEIMYVAIDDACKAFKMTQLQCVACVLVHWQIVHAANHRPPLNLPSHFLGLLTMTLALDLGALLNYNGFWMWIKIELKWIGWRERKKQNSKDEIILSNATNKIAMRKIGHRMNGCCCCCCRKETANTENQKIMERNIEIIKTHIDTRRQWHLAAHKSRVYSKKEYKTVGESNKNELSQLT